MSFIKKGGCCMEEMEAKYGKKMFPAYAKDQDNPNKPYYDHWSDIRHPDTGEPLRAVQGYCNPNDMYQCYYAEYQGEDGQLYHYEDENDITDQKYQDAAALRSQERQKEQSRER